MSFSDVEITRYMSMPQFVAFLSQGLFIPKATMFDESLEGLARMFYYEESPTTKQEIDWAKEWTYISCWYKSFEESMAMWHIYGKHTEAIAVHTSTAKLMEVIDKNNFLKQYPKRFNFVSYMDSKRYPSPLFDTKLNPRANNNKKYIFNDLVDEFYFKHQAFKHEDEVRLCLVDKKPLDPYTENTKSGVLVKNAIDCISMITLSPYSPDWYAVAIQETVKKFGMTARVYKSDLDWSKDAFKPTNIF